MWQDDTVMGMLTVRENIAFSAALRMPRRATAEERAFQVDKVIKDLGLEDCADTKVTISLPGKVLIPIDGRKRRGPGDGADFILPSCELTN